MLLIGIAVLGSVLALVAWFDRRRPAPPKYDSRARRLIWYALGALWLIDGFLQAQPAMVTPIFADMVLQPAQLGQPAWLSSLMQLGITLWIQHPMVGNTLSTLLQWGIGFLMLTGYRRLRGQVGVWLSIGWGGIVWVFGEGMGGIFAGGPSFIGGSPGSALLYALLSIALLAPVERWRSGWMTALIRYALAGYFMLGALWQALPSSGFWQSDNLLGLIGKNAGMPQPQWIRGAIEAVANAAYDHPVLWNSLLVAILLVSGALVLVKKMYNTSLLLLYLFLFMIWWFGQDFGFLGGYGTDVNTAPLLGLVIHSLSGRKVSILKRWASWHQLGHS